MQNDNRFAKITADEDWDEFARYLDQCGFQRTVAGSSNREVPPLFWIYDEIGQRVIAGPFWTAEHAQGHIADHCNFLETTLTVQRTEQQLLGEL